MASRPALQEMLKKVLQKDGTSNSDLHKETTPGKVFCVCSLCGQSSVATRQDTRAGRKRKCVILTVPTGRAQQAHQAGPHGKDIRMVGRLKIGVREGST